ncbi:Protein cft1 [Erysiphe neolycopersici]|uniref:Protein CFT1 n=1 Tax=Erysiphe neolycopersici TaxID=212602 RepID=A0A420HM33_9PEZI|nr:Protein cft1 [Erysiphe neolycopersici]
MQCYTELTPPTAVTHSLILPFTSAESNNLVIARTSLLQIFTTKIISNVQDYLHRVKAENGEKNDSQVNDIGVLETKSGGDFARIDRARRTKLILLAEYPLSGTVTSLARVKLQSSKSGGDALLVGTKDAKLSLAEWDPSRSELSTISIHYYEQDDLHSSPWAPSLKDSVSYMSADPGSRCAALKFGLRCLAILPFKQGDEDVHMGDWENELGESHSIEKVSSKAVNGNITKEETPFSPSFVLKLPSLDSTLFTPIHLSFLYEYREPTFGILASINSPSSSLLFERKDILTYMVFTLDLHQKASTTILSVSGLPYDLTQVLPLPAPVGGALLIGRNELIHIDQAGKVNGVAVNIFAKQCTSLNLHDQSELEMGLEGCKIEQLSIESGELIIILQTGQIAILNFHVDGRSVSGLRIRRVSENAGGFLVLTQASCTCPLGPNALFIGSEFADSVILSWDRKSNQTSRRKHLLEFSEGSDDISLEEDDDDDVDDDLYGDGQFTSVNNQDVSDVENNKTGDYLFYINDSLMNLGPISDVTFAKPLNQISNLPSNKAEFISGQLDMVIAIGKERAGSIAIIHENIYPEVIRRLQFPEARGIWTINVKKPTNKSNETLKDKYDSKNESRIEDEYDKLMIISKESGEGTKISDVYVLGSACFEALTGTEFEPEAGATIEASTLGNGLRIIQVLKSEVRSYDGVGVMDLWEDYKSRDIMNNNNTLNDLGLAQIIPMYDDDTGAEPKILSASFADPFLLLVRDDSSIYVAQCDNSNELEEIEKVEKSLQTTKWVAGCLYNDHTCVFTLEQVDKNITSRQNVLLFLLSVDGGLHIYALPNLSKSLYVAEGLCYVPPIHSADFVARRAATRDSLIEILVADLGDQIIKSPYLIVSTNSPLISLKLIIIQLRSSYDDLTIYEPFRIKCSSSLENLSTILRFLKLSNPHLAKNTFEPSEIVTSPMRSIMNVGGFSMVFLPGASPSMILKSSKSVPKVISLQSSGVLGMSGFHTAGCERGFIYADMEGIMRIAQLPSNTSFVELGKPLQRIEIGEEVHAITYHPPMECYVIGTSSKVEFELPKDDDHHREWAREDISFKPTVEQSSIKLINPINWSIIQEIDLEPCESILCIKSLSLEVSEITNECKQLITIGTAICKGEDLPTKGRIYVYDIVIAVPEPGRPETNKRLKLVSKEDIGRGAVTAVSEIGTQGFMLVSQGQKCMVRGLKEDGSLLPVAFMDMNCYVTCIKELRGTGLCIFSDIIKGVWFAGYTEEPYKMMLFGKSAKNLEVIAAELLPHGKELYIVVADVNCNLHILEYDPEHPKSIQGHLLLHRSTFAFGGHFPKTLTLLPRTKAPTINLSNLHATDYSSDVANTQDYHIIITTSTGCISVLSPLSEFQYRRLSTLTTHLANTLSHPLGLNPKMYRIDREAPDSMAGSRTVVDGALLSRWMELGSQRRAEVAGRVGIDVDQIRDDLVDLQCGLRYL